MAKRHIYDDNGNYIGDSLDEGPVGSDVRAGGEGLGKIASDLAKKRADAADKTLGAANQKKAIANELPSSSPSPAPKKKKTQKMIMVGNTMKLVDDDGE